jgi:hypothetical protein
MMTVSTVHAYANVCSRLSGFPGLLQKAGLTGAGTCVTKLGGLVCASGSTCTTANGSGICRNTAVSGSPVCSCVAATVSKGSH